jgi:hypothetical protein
VHELGDFSQNKEAFDCRNLDFREFPLEVLDEDILQTPGNSNRLLADQLDGGRSLRSVATRSSPRRINNGGATRDYSLGAAGVNRYPLSPRTCER